MNIFPKIAISRFRRNRKSKTSKPIAGFEAFLGECQYIELLSFERILIALAHGFVGGELELRDLAEETVGVAL